MDVLKIYDDVQKDVQAIYRSRLQVQILLSLSAKGQSLSDLRDVTGSTSQALLPKIRVLEANKLIESIEHEYRLTPLGRIIASKVSDSVKTMGTVLKHKEFFYTHHLSGIPDELLKDIGLLYNSEVVSDTNVEIFNVYNNYLKMVKEAGEIYGVSAIMSSGHADSLAARILDGIPVELIVTADVLGELGQQVYAEQINSLLQNENFKIFVVQEQIKLGFTVTDKRLSIGLYKDDGITYDSTMDLFSFDDVAIQWGKRLFEYYRSRAEEFKGY
ncbi:putative transcriptional regulator [Methanohalophilus levihalophilus]|uniref:helix-turn-helix transcriptional regulator n=1 Tax=Methanohalophilus levihalophilus TaxID=1431282 RepID=UPI001AE46D35|nr:transcriptional regulator FilR1 domain-containing protein [Methanohalophilus levihalophilus]MBP2031099.1 putative transcriptional regulator [Methanohalophilus levihalophilus]